MDGPFLQEGPVSGGGFMRGDPFQGVSADEMEHMISSARLGRKDSKIARLKLIDRLTDIETSAEFEARERVSRTTVARRMKGIVAALQNGR